MCARTPAHLINWIQAHSVTYKHIVNAPFTFFSIHKGLLAAGNVFDILCCLQFDYKKGKMQQDNHLHTHAHKTQTYWPSQANNKLIWAILVLCRGTKQRVQTGRGSIFPEMRFASPPSYFLTPVASPFLTYGVDIITTVSGADLWHPASDNGRGHEKWRGGIFVAPKIDSCVLPSLHNNSQVWLGFHG